MSIHFLFWQILLLLWVVCMLMVVQLYHLGVCYKMAFSHWVPKMEDLDWLRLMVVLVLLYVIELKLDRYLL